MKTLGGSFCKYFSIPIGLYYLSFDDHSQLLNHSSAHHEREIFPITYFPQSGGFNAVKNTVSRLELSCHPLEGVFDFDKRPGSARSELSKDLNRLIEGGPESLEDREKW
jgi:hypothetical protein